MFICQHHLCVFIANEIQLKINLNPKWKFKKKNKPIFFVAWKFINFTTAVAAARSGIPSGFPVWAICSVALRGLLQNLTQFSDNKELKQQQLQKQLQQQEEQGK